MKLVIARLVNLVHIPVFVVTEFAIRIFVHPVLKKLPESCPISSVQVLGSILGKIIPICIPTIIISTLPVLYFDHAQNLSFWLTIVGVVCIIVMLIISLTGSVPIIKKVIDWNPQSPPNNWLELRSRCDKRRKIRILLDLAAFSTVFSYSFDLKRVKIKSVLDF